MDLRQYKKTVQTISKKATLVFLTKEDRVLLAMKKRGFGVGKWNGVGGKPQGSETLEEAAKREAQEEIGVSVRSLEKVAILGFYFPEAKAGWNQEVTVYLVDAWVNEPSESEEMRPKWFKYKDIPYDDMWWDDKLWLPKVLAGKKLTAEFLFDETDKVEDYKISESDKF